MLFFYTRPNGRPIGPFAEHEFNGRARAIKHLMGPFKDQDVHVIRADSYAEALTKVPRS